MIYIKNNRTISVGNGFTVWGFIFAWGWLFSKALWLKGVVVLVIYFPTYFFQSIMMTAFFGGTKVENYYLLAPTLLLLIIHLTIGFKGRQWLRDSIQRKGYKPV